MSLINFNKPRKTDFSPATIIFNLQGPSMPLEEPKNHKREEKIYLIPKNKMEIHPNTYSNLPEHGKNYLKNIINTRDKYIDLSYDQCNSAFSKYLPAQVILTKKTKREETIYKKPLKILIPYLNYNPEFLQRNIDSKREMDYIISPQDRLNFAFECSKCTTDILLSFKYEKDINNIFPKKLISCSNCKIFFCRRCIERHFILDCGVCQYCLKSLDKHYFE